MDWNWILFRALKMTITNNNCGDQGQDVAMSYTDTITKQVLTEDKNWKNSAKSHHGKKKSMDDNKMFLTTRTFKCHLILSLALTIPIHKDV
jgi:hypothetical protein